MIRFWNGNKSPARQRYELELLQLIVNSQSTFPVIIDNDQQDYPKAEDEGNIFSQDIDVLATIAGNKKFADNPLISINQPLCKGLLGYRILIIRQQDSDKFKQIDELSLKHLVAGIPATWVDADLFRENQYRVHEQGTLEDILQQLKEGVCDYVSLGANEVQSLFTQFAAPLEGLVIESNIVLHYPFPLVFYVHPDNKKLALQIQRGLKQVMLDGTFDALFNRHYGHLLEQLSLVNRQLINLENAQLPLQFTTQPSQLPPQLLS